MAKVFVTNGIKFADSLSSGAAVGIQERAIILVEKSRISKAVKNYLKNVNDIVIVGGEDSVEEDLLKEYGNKKIVKEDVLKFIKDNK